MQFQVLSVAVMAALAISSTGQAAVREAATVRANALLNGSAAALAHKASADSFVTRNTITDKDGTEHVRFDRTYQGLPVIGGDVIVHSRGGVLRGVSQSLVTSYRPGLAPSISKERSIIEAGVRFGTNYNSTPTSRLIIYARKPTPVLAYEVRLTGVKPDQTPTDMRYIVNASNGVIIDQWDTIETVTPGGGGTACVSPVTSSGTGKSIYLGNVPISTTKCSLRFQMLDATRGGGYTTNLSNRQSGGAIFVDADNVWGNNLITDSASAAVDAHYGVSLTWDYYKNVHGRSGIANDGVGALSRVHYGVNYANAFWSDACFCMSFGDGDGVVLGPLLALDVAGHEMSHGVTSRTADLAYIGESGGLNEATSDIMGTMVEYYANNAADPPDYLIGEKLYKITNGTMALRYMFKPSLDGKSVDCYDDTVKDLDVHYSSGVGNHFYYLLAEGAKVPDGFGSSSSYGLTPSDLVCNGNTNLVGVGREAAEKIWYRALTVYMVSDTTYATARAATISAATDLYGATSATTTAVKNAWSAVAVN